MTLVFERAMAGPATHAFIVGCGRYPYLGADHSADRLAPVSGAFALADMLIESRDSLVVPLGTVEVLVSDPGDEPGSPAQVGERSRAIGVASVDPADELHFRASGQGWIDRVRPGDSVIFYFSGHGIADRTGGAVGLLEDIKVNKNLPWAQSFGVTQLILALRTLSAASAWVFFDACQDVAIEFANRLWEVKNVDLKEVSLADLIGDSCQPLAIASSRLGQKAWAPDQYEPPYFTQVLLKGLSGCCVEKTKQHGWAITGQALLFKLVEIGEAIIDEVAVRPESVSPYSERSVLMAVASPFTPVAVRSSPEMHLKLAASVRLMDGAAILKSSNEPPFVWRVDVPLEERYLTVECDVHQGAVLLAAQTFQQQPPGHTITLIPAGGAA